MTHFLQKLKKGVMKRCYCSGFMIFNRDDWTNREKKKVGILN
jgi:hypothetical protein